VRVLVCGGRDFWDKDLFERTMSQLEQIDVIIQGGAMGADFLAKKFAEKNKIKMIEFKADWKSYGKSAGAIRNQQMINEGFPNLVVAFPGGRGTADMVRRSRIHHIRVMEIT
jgi:hypothetical protein